jgi:CrcB protein
VKLWLAIAVGGALGAVGRHAVVNQMVRWAGDGFPWGTLTVNVSGSLVMGLLIQALALRFEVDDAWRGLLAVGVLGAFTTFSAFSLDVVLLAQRGQIAAAAVYVAGSVIGALVGIAAGLALGRALWA